MEIVTKLSQKRTINDEIVQCIINILYDVVNVIGLKLSLQITTFDTFYNNVQKLGFILTGKNHTKDLLFNKRFVFDSQYNMEKLLKFISLLEKGNYKINYENEKNYYIIKLSIENFILILKIKITNLDFIKKDLCMISDFELEIKYYNETILKVYDSTKDVEITLMEQVKLFLRDLKNNKLNAFDFIYLINRANLLLTLGNFLFIKLPPYIGNLLWRKVAFSNLKSQITYITSKNIYNDIEKIENILKFSKPKNINYYSFFKDDNELNMTSLIGILELELDNYKLRSYVSASLPNLEFWSNIYLMDKYFKDIDSFLINAFIIWKFEIESFNEKIIVYTTIDQISYFYRLVYETFNSDRNFLLSLCCGDVSDKLNYLLENIVNNLTPWKGCLLKENQFNRIIYIVDVKHDFYTLKNDDIIFSIVKSTKNKSSTTIEVKNIFSEKKLKLNMLKVSKEGETKLSFYFENSNKQLIRLFTGLQPIEALPFSNIYVVDGAS